LTCIRRSSLLIPWHLHTDQDRLGIAVAIPTRHRNVIRAAVRSESMPAFLEGQHQVSGRIAKRLISTFAESVIDYSEKVIHELAPGLSHPRRFKSAKSPKASSTTSAPIEWKEGSSAAER